MLDSLVDSFELLLAAEAAELAGHSRLQSFSLRSQQDHIPIVAVIGIRQPVVQRFKKLVFFVI
jgi:hypothetical protein